MCLYHSSGHPNGTSKRFIKRKLRNTSDPQNKSTQNNTAYNRLGKILERWIFVLSHKNKVLDQIVFNFDNQMIFKYVFLYLTVWLTFPSENLWIDFFKSHCSVHRFSSLLARALPLVVFVILINVTQFFHLSSYKYWTDDFINFQNITIYMGMFDVFISYYEWVKF